ncbi:ABC transporter ATP-binding protein/permease [Haloarcula sp. S1CR25-12]|uniref:ABC transporter ATP-binding protein/permease n=1 Tax=Haloarcula saliterrae TaxID=2950534 RepID=A0ABU2FI42_9EURY|nr:ABC transporter ATP-binding protein [Haloarcula sp. S1CR25-12]MDS0261451.1 ABC transporter ATP-binding protein/permease [Haloarcula sp. S1CR25-12]
MEEEPSLREKLAAIRLVVGYRPGFAAGIVVLNLITAVFEGIGLGLLLPVIEAAQTGGDLRPGTSGVTGYYFAAYEILGIPFSFETIILGLAGVMTVRYALSFLTGWLQVKLRTEYICHLRQQCFDNLLSAEVSFIDREDSDRMMNIIVTEIAKSSGAINQLLSVAQTLFFVGIYLALALSIAPVLTVVAMGLLGGVVGLTRYVVQPSYDIGDRVANANERIQGLVNAGMRGMQEIKLFNMSETLTDEFRDAHSEFFRTNLALARNQTALNSATQWLNALGLFGVIYIAIGYLDLSFASLGLLLLTMFRLSPQISSLNDNIYRLDGTLPHIVRSHELIDELDRHAESSGGEPAPDPVTDVSLDGVSFRYDDDEGTDITDISLRASRDETVAVVGPSGAGKSTIVSLIARLYDPDDGAVRANGVDLRGVDLDSWHQRVAVVPQHPFIFNETLRYNIAIGNPDASDAEIERSCEASQVSAFVDELPEGLDTDLGDDAVRLSGGQRQRVAIARALLADADVLLLDEATSELDGPTEDAILRGIDGLNQEYITVVIGHFLSTVRDADRIYTVVDGEIVETGSHSELMANDSRYAQLYGSQRESTPQQ